MCDLPHVFKNAAMLMPTCCNKGICTYAFTELNVGKDSADGISTSTEVMNLLVSISRAAVHSPRNGVIFEPCKNADPLASPRPIPALHLSLTGLSCTCCSARYRCLALSSQPRLAIAALPS